VGEVKVRDDEVYIGYYFGRGIEVKVAIYYFKGVDKMFVVECGAVRVLGKRSEAEYNAKLAFEDRPEAVEAVKEFLKALP